MSDNLEVLKQAVGQGMTLNMADELIAQVYAKALSDNTPGASEEELYAMFLEDMREDRDKARESFPALFDAVELVSSLVMPGGAAAKGGKALTRVAKQSGEGVVSGIGSADTDKIQSGILGGLGASVGGKFADFLGNRAGRIKQRITKVEGKQADALGITPTKRAELSEQIEQLASKGPTQVGVAKEVVQESAEQLAERKRTLLSQINESLQAQGIKPKLRLDLDPIGTKGRSAAAELESDLRGLAAKDMSPVSRFDQAEDRIGVLLQGTSNEAQRRVFQQGLDQVRKAKQELVQSIEPSLAKQLEKVNKNINQTRELSDIVSGVRDKTPLDAIKKGVGGVAKIKAGAGVTQVSGLKDLGGMAVDLARGSTKKLDIPSTSSLKDKLTKTKELTPEQLRRRRKLGARVGGNIGDSEE